MSKMKNDIISTDSSLSLNNPKINSNEYENNNNNERNIYDSNIEKSSKSRKKVKILEQAFIIEVESWKKYNLDQAFDENYDDYLEEIEKNENKKEENNNNNNKNNKSRNKSKDSITCTCNII